MDPYETIWVKQEETDETPNETGTVTGKKAALDHYETIWIKQDTDEAPNEAGSAVQIHPSSVHVKGELEDLNQESVEDPLGVPGSEDIIKEVPEVILQVDETENIVAASTRCESDRTQLVQSTGERCGTTFEETVNEGVVCNELEIGTEKSTHFTPFSTGTQGLTEQEENLHSTRLKCILIEKDFNRFSCSFCLRSFSSRYCLIMHVFTHIDGVEPPTHVCTSCGEVFLTDVGLNEHMKRNEGDEASSGYNDETYPICRKSSTAGNVTNDTILLTAKRSHTCNICGKSFTTSGNLNRHALIHSGQRPHKCVICGKSFPDTGNLRRHALIHTGTKLKCNVCDKPFTQSGDLKRHILTHNGERPYKCDICDKSFTHFSIFKRHKLTHTGIRPHKCNICDKSFTRLDHLKNHALIHISVSPHL